MVTCPSCDNSNNVTAANFCYRCGYPLRVVESASASEKQKLIYQRVKKLLPGYDVVIEEDAIVVATGPKSKGGRILANLFPNWKKRRLEPRWHSAGEKQRIMLAVVINQTRW